MTTPRSVLFLCTGNSARSQLAEALLRHMAKGQSDVSDGEQFVVMSAGTHPEGVDPRVHQLLAQRGIDSSMLTSKSLAELPPTTFDFIITLCDKARGECAAIANAGEFMHWDFADPKPSAGLTAFEKVMQELAERIRLFVLIHSRAQGGAVLSPVELFKALGDEIRLKSLLLLEDEGELCVCELMTALNEPQPKISRHLALMREAAVVVDRRQGQWVFYRLNPQLPEWVVQLLRATRLGNGAWLKVEQQRLRAMTSRPGRDGRSCSTAATNSVSES